MRLSDKRPRLGGLPSGVRSFWWLDLEVLSLLGLGFIKP